jgi:hypothetical protein
MGRARQSVIDRRKHAFTEKPNQVDTTANSGSGRLEAACRPFGPAIDSSAAQSGTPWLKLAKPAIFIPGAPIARGRHADRGAELPSSKRVTTQSQAHSTASGLVNGGSDKARCSAACANTNNHCRARRDG